MAVQIDAQGNVTYDESQGDTGSWSDYLTKHLPKAFGSVAGDVITPSLNAVGGQFNARDYIQQHLLRNRGGESLPAALGKGALEGVANLVVPKASADLQGEVLGLGAGEALSGLKGLRADEAAGRAGFDAARAARDRVRANYAKDPIYTARPGETGPRVVQKGPYATSAEVPTSGVQNAAKRSAIQNEGWLGEGKGEIRGGQRAKGRMVARRGTHASQSAREIEMNQDAVTRQQPGAPGYTPPETSPTAQAGAGQATVKQLGSQGRNEALGDYTQAMKTQQLEEGTQKMYDEQAGEGLRQMGLPAEDPVLRMIHNFEKAGMTPEQIKTILMNKYAPGRGTARPY